MKTWMLLTALVANLVNTAFAQSTSRPRTEFTRMIAHWAEYADPGYLPFVEAAQPEVAQIGFYGAHFWSLAHTEHGKGYPAHFPLVGIAENRAWFANRNRELRQRGVKIVGHFNVKFLVGDPDSPPIAETKKKPAEPGGPRGFFKFYRELWDESLLGKKPVDDPLDLLEKDIAGQPITNNSYSIGGMKEYWGCLNNPHWRAVLKAWIKHGVELGCDGFVANYFYRHDCHCPHCVAGFKAYLAEQFAADELNLKFQISDLKSHKFPEIVAWHNPAESTPLRREMLRFSQIANKRAFDEVFVKYGRSLKPDLIVGQWNHIGNFNQINGDERCLLPGDLWGRDEDYLWYSTGGAAHFTDLAEGYLGEGTLQARYIRGAFDDKPFTLGKYENTRIRVAIAELAANGGAPMGFYTRFKDTDAQAEIVRYYQFIKRHDEIYQGNRPQHEVLLAFPRRAIHDGKLTALAQFKEWGKQLLDEHVLFDVIPDDLLTADARNRYRTVLVPQAGATNAEAPHPDVFSERSRFEAPKTVRISMSKPRNLDEWTLHLVNYNREEPKEQRSAGRGIVEEKPIAAAGIRVDLLLPEDRRIQTVELLTPEQPEPVKLNLELSGRRLRFNISEFLVYGVVRIR